MDFGLYSVWFGDLRRQIICHTNTAITFSCAVETVEVKGVICSISLIYLTIVWLQHRVALLDIWYNY